MASKNLKYFMRDVAKEEQVITVQGLESIKDENGNIVPLRIKKLHNSKINEIHEMYRERKPLKDKKGNYVIQNGEVVYALQKDNARALRHIIVEALEYPNLRDDDLMKFFGCVDITQMPLLVFPDAGEYAYITKKVMEVLEMIDPAEDESREIEDAKN